MKHKIVLAALMQSVFLVQAGTLSKGLFFCAGLAAGFTAADVYKDACPIKNVLQAQVRSMTPDQARDYVVQNFRKHVAPFQTGKDFAQGARAHAVHGLAAGLVVAEKYGQCIREHVTRA